MYDSTLGDEGGPVKPARGAGFERARPTGHTAHVFLRQRQLHRPVAGTVRGLRLPAARLHTTVSPTVHQATVETLVCVGEGMHA